MKKDEIIELTKEWFDGISDVRKRMKLITIALKKNSYDSKTIQDLKIEYRKLNYKLKKIINALSVLKEDDQKMMCYKYFDKLTFSDISLRMGCSRSTAERRVQKNLLPVGRIMFGMEDEFWREIDKYSIH